MRLTCPACGPRDRREFTYQGNAALARRPAPAAPPEDWHSYLHLRDNPAGASEEIWYHDPCGTFAIVTRDTLTHAVAGSIPATEARR
ncbi:MAG: sarcosine oxidase subunit delta [Rubellimicrobium sp.]|nr:sarcosine oxidase subunit delta [Rubellimicrobium sp.]